MSIEERRINPIGMTCQCKDRLTKPGFDVQLFSTIGWTDQQRLVICCIRQYLIPPAVGCICTEGGSRIYTASIHIVTKKENRVIVVAEIHLQP